MLLQILNKILCQKGDFWWSKIVFWKPKFEICVSKKYQIPMLFLQTKKYFLWIPPQKRVRTFFLSFLTINLHLLGSNVPILAHKSHFFWRKRMLIDKNSKYENGKSDANRQKKSLILHFFWPCQMGKKWNFRGEMCRAS